MRLGDDDDDDDDDDDYDYDYDCDDEMRSGEDGVFACLMMSEVWACPTT